MTLFENYDSNYKTQNKNLTRLSPHIRRALSRDLVAIARLNAIRHQLPFQQALLSIQRDYEGVQKNFQKRMLCVAEIDGEVVGFGRCGWNDTYPEKGFIGLEPGWYLMGIIVDEKYRRRGIGKAITQYRINWIFERSKSVHYFANILNKVSIELHKKFGFREYCRDISGPGISFVGGVGAAFKLIRPQPDFGEKLPQHTYYPRPGCYAVIPNKINQIAIVEWQGQYFLPGGGIEQGESLRECLHREVKEELGWSVSILKLLGWSNHYCYASDLDQFLFKEGAFYLAQKISNLILPAQAGNHLVWMSIDEAILNLTSFSQQWILKEHLKKSM